MKKILQIEFTFSDQSSIILSENNITDMVFSKLENIFIKQGNELIEFVTINHLRLTFLKSVDDVYYEDYEHNPIKFSEKLLNEELDVITLYYSDKTTKDYFINYDLVEYKEKDDKHMMFGFTKLEEKEGN